MKIISVAWTTEALLAGRKTCTRRGWKDRWAEGCRSGDLVAAYDRQPRYGGHQVALIKLLESPYKQSTKDAPEEDYEREGFAYMEEHGLTVGGLVPRMFWRAWKLKPQWLGVGR